MVLRDNGLSRSKKGTLFLLPFANIELGQRYDLFLSIHHMLAYSLIRQLCRIIMAFFDCIGGVASVTF